MSQHDNTFRSHSIVVYSGALPGQSLFTLALLYLSTVVTRSTRPNGDKPDVCKRLQNWMCCTVYCNSLAQELEATVDDFDFDFDFDFDNVVCWK